MERESFVFYKSFYEAINGLPEEQQVKLYKAIMEYSLYQNEIELDTFSNAMFQLIKPQLDANQKRYENGKKGGRKKKIETKTKPKKNQKVSTETLEESNYTEEIDDICDIRINNTEPKENQNITTTEPNVNVNVNVNDNVNVNENENTKTSPLSPLVKKNKKDAKHKHGEYKKVLLTDQEYESLNNTVEHVEDLIKILDEYIETSGKKYKNHYLMLKNKWPMTEYKKLHPVEIIKTEEKPLLDENTVSDEEFQKMLAKYD